MNRQREQKKNWNCKHLYKFQIDNQQERNANITILKCFISLLCLNVAGSSHSIHKALNESTSQ
jgi:hypothetical protein